MRVYNAILFLHLFEIFSSKININVTISCNETQDFKEREGLLSPSGHSQHDLLTAVKITALRSSRGIPPTHFAKLITQPASWNSCPSGLSQKSSTPSSVSSWHACPDQWSTSPCVKNKKREKRMSPAPVQKYKDKHTPTPTVVSPCWEEEEDFSSMDL